MGDFVIELFLEQTPITASNFIDLAQSGFYDGLHVHRVISGSMAQFGCPFSRDMTGKSGRPGTGGPRPGSTYRNLQSGESIRREELRGKGVIPDERVARISNLPGTLAMANTGPNSAGSQCFVNVRRSTSLDWFSPGPSRHVCFAQVVENFVLVERIAAADTGDFGGDAPATPVRIDSITVTVDGQELRKADDKDGVDDAQETDVHGRPAAEADEQTSEDVRSV